MWLGSLATYLALFYLTFFHQWNHLMGDDPKAASKDLRHAD